MKAKAMKKTLSCILALTLTASMMAENLTAFAANGSTGQSQSVDAPDAPESDDIVTATEVTKEEFQALFTEHKFGDIENLELLNEDAVEISAPDNRTFFITDKLPEPADLTDYYIVATFRKVTDWDNGAVYEKTGNGDADKLYKFQIPVVTMNGGEAVYTFADPAAELGWYHCTGNNNYSIVDDLDDFDTTDPTDPFGVTLNAAEVSYGVVIGKGTEKLTWSDNLETSTLSEDNDDAYFVKKAVVKSAALVPAEGKKYYLGQTLNAGFLNDTIQLYYNDGTEFELPESAADSLKIAYNKAISVAGTETYSGSTYEIFNYKNFTAVRCDDATDYVSITPDNQNKYRDWSTIGEKPGTHTIYFKWRPEDAAVRAAVGLGDGEYIVVSGEYYVEWAIPTDLTFHEGSEYKKSYTLNEEFRLGENNWNDAYFDVVYNAPQDYGTALAYIPKTYNGSEYAWYLTTPAAINDLASKTDTAYTTALSGVNFTDASGWTIVTYDTSKPTAEGETLTFSVLYGSMEKPLDLEGIKVDDSKVETATATVNLVAEKDNAARTTTVGNKNEVVFANRDTLDFVKGEVDVTLTYANGVTRKIDLAESIDLFTTDAAGTKPAKDAIVDQATGNETNIVLYYQGTDKASEEGIAVNIPAKIITDELTVLLDFAKDDKGKAAYKNVYYVDEEADFTGIKARIKHTSWQQEAKSTFVDLATIAKEDGWTVTFVSSKVTSDTQHALTVEYSKGIVAATKFVSTEEISVVADYITEFVLSATPVKPFAKGYYAFTNIVAGAPDKDDVIAGVKIAPVTAKNGQRDAVLLEDNEGNNKLGGLANVVITLPEKGLDFGKNTITVTVTPTAGYNTKPIVHTYDVTIEQPAIKEAKFAMKGDEIKAAEAIDPTSVDQFENDTIKTHFTPDKDSAIKVGDITNGIEDNGYKVIITYSDGKKGLLDVTNYGGSQKLKDGNIDASVEKTVDTAVVFTCQYGDNPFIMEVPVTIYVAEQQAVSLVSLKGYKGQNEVETLLTTYVGDTAPKVNSEIDKITATFKDGGKKIEGNETVDTVFSITYTRGDEDVDFASFFEDWAWDTEGEYGLYTENTGDIGQTKTLGLTYLGPTDLEKTEKNKPIWTTVQYSVSNDKIESMKVVAPTKLNYLTADLDDDNMIVPADGSIVITHADKKLFKDGIETVSLVDVFAGKDTRFEVNATPDNDGGSIRYTLSYKDPGDKPFTWNTNNSFDISIVADVVKTLTLTAPTEAGGSQISGYWQNEKLDIEDGSILVTPELGDAETLSIPLILTGYNKTDKNSWYSHAQVDITYTDADGEVQDALDEQGKIKDDAAKAGEIYVTIFIDEKEVEFSLGVDYNIPVSITLGDGIYNKETEKIEGTVKDKDGKVVPAFEFLYTQAEDAPNAAIYIEGTVKKGGKYDTEEDNYSLLNLINATQTTAPNPPTPGTYTHEIGESILLNYKNGTTQTLDEATIDQFSIEGFDPDKTGVQTVTLKYKPAEDADPLTATFDVCVIDDFISSATLYVNTTTVNADENDKRFVGNVDHEQLFDENDAAVLKFEGSGKTITVDLADEKQFNKYFAFVEGKEIDYSKVGTRVAYIKYLLNPQIVPKTIADAMSNIPIYYTIAADTAKVTVDATALTAAYAPGKFTVDALKKVNVTTLFTVSGTEETATLYDLLTDDRYLVTIDNRLTGEKATAESIAAVSQVPGVHTIYVSWIDTEGVKEYTYGESIPSFSFAVNEAAITGIKVVTPPDFNTIDQYDKTYDTTGEEFDNTTEGKLLRKWTEDQDFAIEVSYDDGSKQILRSDKIYDLAKNSGDHGTLYPEVDPDNDADISVDVGTFIASTPVKRIQLGLTYAQALYFVPHTEMNANQFVYVGNEAAEYDETNGGKTPDQLVTTGEKMYKVVHNAGSEYVKITEVSAEERATLYYYNDSLELDIGNFSVNTAKDYVFQFVYGGEFKAPMTFTVKEKKIEGELIEVTAPTYTVYGLGQKLDTAGWTIKVGESGTPFAVTSEMVSGFDTSKLAEKMTATVTYGGLTLTKDFEVVAPDAVSDIKLTTLPTKVEYLPSEKITVAGAVADITYIMNDDEDQKEEVYTVTGVALTDEMFTAFTYYDPIPTEASVLKTKLKGILKIGEEPYAAQVLLYSKDVTENYITVNVNTLKTLAVTDYTTDYYLGTTVLGLNIPADTLDAKTGNVTMTYQDGTKKTITLEDFVALITNDASVGSIKYNNEAATAATQVTAGVDEIILSYKEGGVTKTATAKLNLIKREATGIDVDTLPVKTFYSIGDSFDPTGGIIGVTLNSDTEENEPHKVNLVGKCAVETDITVDEIEADGEFHIFGFDSTKAAKTQTITVAFRETEKSEVLKTTFDVVINDLAIEKIALDDATVNAVKTAPWTTANEQDDILKLLKECNPDVSVYFNDEKHTVAKEKLFVQDDDGNATDVLTTGFTIGVVDFSKSGNTNVVITMGDHTAEITITIAKKQIDKDNSHIVTTLDDLSEEDKKIVTSVPVMEYEQDADFDPTKGFMKIVYNNGKVEYVAFSDSRILIQQFDTTEITDTMTFNVIYLDDDDIFRTTLTVKVTEAKVKVESIVPEVAELNYHINDELTYLDTKVQVTYSTSKTPVVMTLGDGITNDKLRLTIKTKGGEDVTAIDKTKPGEYVLSITSAEDPTAAAATIELTVADKLVSGVETAVNTLSFKKNTPLADIVTAVSGINVTISYDTGEKVTKTAAELVAAGLITVDTTKVDITKAGSYTASVISTEDVTKKADVTVVVTDITVNSFKVDKTNFEFKVGDEIVIDAKATITYSEGDPVTVPITDTTKVALLIVDDATGSTVAGIGKIDKTKAGSYTITASAVEDTNKTATIKVTIKEQGKIDVDEDDPTPVVPVSESAVVAFEKSGEDWVEKAGYDSLTAAFDKTAYGAKTATGDYMFVITGKVSEAKALKFPANAKSITIVGDEDAELNLGKATTINAKNADITLNVKVTGAGLNVSVGAGKTLTVGSLVEKLGKVAGNKNSSKFVATGDVTVDNIQSFAEVDVNGDSVLTINTKGKMNNIAKLKAQVRFIDNTSTAANITADQVIFHLVQAAGAKQPFAKVTLADIISDEDSFVEVCIEDSELKEAVLDEKTPAVLWTTGKADLTKDGKISIVNIDDENNELSAVSYNKNKEIRAEFTGLLDVEVGEATESFSSFEKAFEYLADKSGAATITLKGPATLAKATLPKGLSSLTITGDGTDALTVNATAIKVTYDLAFINVPIIAKAASAAALPINLTISTTGSKLTIEDVMFDAKSVKIAGKKKTTELVIGGVNGVVDNIENFAKVTVNGAIAANKKVTVGTIAFDGGQLSLGNGAAAKIDNIEGTGVLGLTKAATAKKFKAITLTAMSADAKVTLVQVKSDVDGNNYKIMTIEDGDFEAGTVIFADKSKGAIKYGGDDAQFDASGLAEGAELELNNKKVTLVIK